MENTPTNLTIHRDDADFFNGLPDYQAWSKAVLHDMGEMATRFCGGHTKYQVLRSLLNDLDHPTPESKYRQCVMEIFARKRNITTQWGEIMRLRLEAEAAQLRGIQLTSKAATITDPIERRLTEIEAERHNLEVQKCEIAMSDIKEMVLTQIREGSMLVEKARELEAGGAMVDQLTYVTDTRYEDERSSKRIEHEHRMMIEQEVQKGLGVVEAQTVFNNLMAERAALAKSGGKGLLKP